MAVLVIMNILENIYFKRFSTLTSKLCILGMQGIRLICYLILHFESLDASLLWNQFTIYMCIYITVSILLNRTAQSNTNAYIVGFWQWPSNLSHLFSIEHKLKLVPCMISYQKRLTSSYFIPNCGLDILCFFIFTRSWSELYLYC